MITFITAHFSDLQWTSFWYKRIRETIPSGLSVEFIIINQDRTIKSTQRLRELGEYIRVVEFPRSEKHFEATGHDHAAVLNKVLQLANGHYISIWDSDAHPLSSGWLDACMSILNDFDAIVAPDDRNPNYSHPCFMFLQKKHLAMNIQFDELLFEQGVDTGRMVVAQLRNNGQKVKVLSSVRAFDGMWGTIFENSVYHHGSGSFAGGGERLRSQIDWRNAYFRDYVITNGRYRFNYFESKKYSLLHRLHNYWRRIQSK
jgi:hypothetical protein